MTKSSIRVRFGPSPSGFMHLGNVQAALLNYLFAQQKDGTFILRIEDTDPQRTVDPEGSQIMKDLAWLALSYNEGPVIGGPHMPYYQSQRGSIYEKYLEQCKEKGLIYRCICSPEELEKKRERQLAIKQPPRYDRACLQLTDMQVSEHLAKKTPFIWRFKLDYSQTVHFYDLAHKYMEFELKHFSDVPITRQDGSFTFMFANFVDDVEMKITHVFRGSDHLTNTAVQVAMYNAFAIEIPVFWHLPIITNAEGKKLSKRDFGFSLADLRAAGYLPEALINYLGIIGHSVEEEIMAMEKLIETFDFDNVGSAGHIRYDLEKLRWINHQWIMRYDTAQLAVLCRPFLEEADPAFAEISTEQLTTLIGHIQKELVTLKDSAELLRFVVSRPVVNSSLLTAHRHAQYQPFFKIALASITDLSSQEVVSTLQALCKEQGIPIKDIFALLRIALTGKPQGPSIKELFEMLSIDEIQARLSLLIEAP